MSQRPKEKLSLKYGTKRLRESHPSRSCPHLKNNQTYVEAMLVELYEVKMKVLPPQENIMSAVKEDGPATDLYTCTEIRTLETPCNETGLFRVVRHGSHELPTHRHVQKLHLGKMDNNHTRHGQSETLGVWNLACGLNSQ